MPTPSPTGAAVYFERAATPKHAPVPSHQAQAKRSPGSARTRHTAAPSRAAIKGPSGSTQVPAARPSTGAAFSAAAAHRPAHSPNRSAVSREHQPRAKGKEDDER